ncbi:MULTISPECIES: sensor domain-containing protein [unclassified Nocardiopsis]|uniref:sensor histidine kinase n=1 Tax=unclassified Nocardiopsis TaxID=2649073 RepID=UPI00135BE161|nr:MULTISPECIES: sensor domain-containing protein [unclassified Nocardiopsis]
MLTFDAPPGPATPPGRGRDRRSRPPTLLRALLSPRFLLTAWPWRALVHNTNTVLVGLALVVVGMPVYLPWTVFTWMLFSRPWDTLAFAPMAALFVCGLVLFAVGAPLLALPLAALQRWCLSLVARGPFPHGHRPPPPGLWGWVRTRYAEGATWREIAYAGLLLPLSFGTATVLGSLFLLGAVLALAPLIVSEEGGGEIIMGSATLTRVEEAVPYALLSPVVLVVLLYASGVCAQVHAAAARALLVGPPRDELCAELSQVTESRARLVNAFEYERRRIERDLHDGAQQRLVALSMELGLARLDLAEGGEADRRVAAAQAHADELITELRELVRGIHPRVLTDRGLPAALAELTDRCPFPARVDAEVPRRLPAHVEGTAYFVAAEALTNVHKHTEANAAAVHASVVPGGPGAAEVLVLEITDYGPGGAEPARGSGLTGLRDRVAVMGGTMELSSPEGGPTRIRVELPCGPIPPTPLT